MFGQIPVRNTPPNKPRYLGIQIWSLVYVLQGHAINCHGLVDIIDGVGVLTNKTNKKNKNKQANTNKTRKQTKLKQVKTIRNK